MQRFKQNKILTGESFILPFTHAGNDITELTQQILRNSHSNIRL